MPKAAPQPAPQTAAPTPPANDHEGVLDRVLGHFTSSRNDAAATPNGSHASTLAASALPFALMAVRRVPVGLAVLGLAAAGIALANPSTREKIFSAGRSGLAALRR